MQQPNRHMLCSRRLLTAAMATNTRCWSCAAGNVDGGGEDDDEGTVERKDDEQARSRTAGPLRVRAPKAISDLVFKLRPNPSI